MNDKILILTPVKNAAAHAENFSSALRRLSYPKKLISIGLLESDSGDNTFDLFSNLAIGLSQQFRRCNIWKTDFGYKVPAGLHHHAISIQVERRAILAKSRNHLLFHALDDEDWVLWLDVDVIEYPPDVIDIMLATGKTIVQPHCVRKYGGRTYDRNAWTSQGKQHMDDLRNGDDLIRLDGVGGAMLLVKADIHRDGLIFPPFLYGKKNERIRNDAHWYGEIETEGLAFMAYDMGVSCWGLPKVEVLHI